MSKLKPLLTLDEASTYLAVSKTTLRRWTNDGRFACHRVGPRNERRFATDRPHHVSGVARPDGCATAQKLIGLIEEAEPDNSCYIEALGRVLAHG